MTFVTFIVFTLLATFGAVVLGSFAAHSTLAAVTQKPQNLQSTLKLDLTIGQTVGPA